MTGVRIILDTSAVLAYAEGSLSVGEVIAELADESASFVIPLPCMIEAGRICSSDRIPGLYVLEAHQHGRVVADRSDRWRSIAGLARVLGRADVAAALMAARDHDAYILTAEPSVYGDFGRDVVIEI